MQVAVTNTDQQETKLTDKELLFAEHFLTNGFNRTQAAIQVGYSEATAHELGSRLLNKVEVRQYVERRKSELKIQVREKYGYTQQTILDELEFAQRMAKEQGNTSAYIKASELKAKMLGLNEPEETKVIHEGYDVVYTFE